MIEKDLALVHCVDANTLTPEQQTELTQVLKKAKKDSFLHSDDDAVIRAGESRIAILYGQEVVGFYSPKRESMNGKTHWRAGALYLDPKYRGIGAMDKILREFFSTHSPGLSWIDDTNVSSIKLFMRLGFVQGKAKGAANGGTGHWYVMTALKEPTLALESLPHYCRW